jgi:hypothetical protein
MSRIITSNYIETLNKVINEFERSPELKLLVEFFTEEVEKDQIRTSNRNQRIFSSNNLEKLNEIKNSKELKRIHTYINIIINAFSNRYLHIHLNIDLSDNVLDNLITLFTWGSLVESLCDNQHLEDEIKSLKTETSRAIIIPNENNGHATNQIFRRRHGQRHRLRFIDKIKSQINNNASSGILINVNTGAIDCVDLSDFSKFPETLNSHVNFGDSLRNTFKKLGEDKVLRISTIVNLFPSITGQNIWYKDFIRDEISRYDNFKKVITITSGEKTPEALFEMNKMNKFQADEIYTLFSFEL